MAKRTMDEGTGLGTATPNLDPTHELPPAGAVQETLGQAKDQVKNLASEAREQAKDLAGQAKDQAKEVANQARDHVQTLVGEQKNQAADRLGSLAEALREAGRKLNEGQQAGDFGQYADRAAQQVERLSTYLRDHELRDFVRDTETFARRRPEVFLGGTLIAGLMLARFLKASSPDQGYDGRDRGGAWTGYPQSSLQSFRSPYQGTATAPRPVSSPLATPERDTTTRQGDLAQAGTTLHNDPIGV